MRVSLVLAVVLDIVLALAAGAMPDASTVADGFALRGGDTVVFLGDSVTAARTYGKIIENYTLLRYPDRKVKFYNAGWGGDTAAGGAKRLERDVFGRGATVLTVAYGMNDIGWGLRADAEHKRAYLDAIREIVRQCRKRNVRCYICSAPITSQDPDDAEKGFLQVMCDEGLAAARESGGGTIDVQRAMRKVQRRVIAVNKRIEAPDKQVKLHAADGVHLNELGQMAMAFAMLKGLGAPADVSSATIDVAKKAVTESTGCEVSELSVTGDEVRFTRRDDGLPINFGLFGALQFVYVPVNTELNRYMLTVENLQPGDYDVSVDGRSVAKYSHGQLGRGVNISSATTDAWQPGGPWDAQATALQSLTEARSQLDISMLMWNTHLASSPKRPDIADRVAAVDAGLQELQRTVARPMPYRFRLTRRAK